MATKCTAKSGSGLKTFRSKAAADRANHSDKVIIEHTKPKK
jgi:hypothetical protein